MSETKRGDNRATRDQSSQSGASSSAGGGGAGGTATKLKGLKQVELPRRGAVFKQIVSDICKPFPTTS